MALPGMPEDRSSKSFWSKKEGTTGMLMIGGGLVAAYFLLPPLNIIMSGLVKLLSNTLYATFLGVGLFIVVYILTNKHFQTLVRYGFKSAMRWVTKWFAEIDPIGIMRSYIDDMQKKRSVVGESVDKLQGQIRVLEQKINANMTGYEKAMATAKVARDKGMASQVQVQGRQAIRLETLNKETYLPLKTQMEAHLRAAKKYYEVTGTVIEDLQNEVTAQEDRRKMIQSSYSMMKAAKQILQGGTTERELFDQALEFVVEDYGMKLGEIENFIENSKPFVDGLDLQNGVYEAEAMKRLQEWESKADSILLGNEKQALLEHTTVSSPVFTSIGAPAAGSVDYADLLIKR